VRRQAAGAHMGEEEGCQASQTGGETTTGAHVMCVHALRLMHGRHLPPAPAALRCADRSGDSPVQSSSSGASRRPIEQS
jgi:hypothetical protein